MFWSWQVLYTSPGGQQPFDIDPRESVVHLHSQFVRTFDDVASSLPHGDDPNHPQNESIKPKKADWVDLYHDYQTKQWRQIVRVTIKRQNRPANENPVKL